MSKSKPKMTPLDWAFVIGGPLAFLAAAATLVMMVIGPPPPPNRVQQIRDGRVRVGMTVEQMQQAVGVPRSATQNEDGSVLYRYTFSGFDQESRQPIEEDAYIDVDATGRVTAINFDRQTPRPPGSAE